MTEQTKELASIDNEPKAISPSTLVADGKYAADALMEIVRHTKAGGSPIVVTISGNEYLKVEAWEFIGKANNTFAATDNVHAIVDDNGDVVAYEAKVNLMKDGMIVGSAIAECGLDSFVTRGAQGRDKHNAAKSMAQTRATSKAFRISFSWVATLAGYQATPAEEMQAVSRGQSSQPQPDNSTEHWCAEHGEEWFKRGRMKNYAHKVGDGWCNMPKAAPEKPQQADTAPQLPRELTAQGFADECANLGVDSNQVDEIFGGKEGIQSRLDAGETWEDLLTVVANVVHPEPAQEDLPW